jgi:hypothetical protein
MDTFDRIIGVMGGLLGQTIKVKKPRPKPKEQRKAPKTAYPATYRYPIPGKPWTREFIASKEFLQTPEWKRARYDALRASDGRCQLCGRNKHQLPPGEHLNVDHIKNRRDNPQFALDVRWLEVLCHPCNEGRGNRCDRDWR